MIKLSKEELLEALREAYEEGREDASNNLACWYWENSDAKKDAQYLGEEL